MPPGCASEIATLLDAALAAGELEPRRHRAARPHRPDDVQRRARHLGRRARPGGLGTGCAPSSRRCSGRRLHSGARGSIPTAGPRQHGHAKRHPGPVARTGRRNLRLISRPAEGASRVPVRRCGPLAWAALLVFLAVMILVDLSVGSAQKHMDVRTAGDLERDLGRRVGRCSAPACGRRRREAGETFFAGYVMEKALSLDNVFVFTLIFGALAVPRDEQPRVLLYGHPHRARPARASSSSRGPRRSRRTRGSRGRSRRCWRGRAGGSCARARSTTRARSSSSASGGAGRA